MPSLFAERDREARRARALALLERLRVGPLADRRPGTFAETLSNQDLIGWRWIYAYLRERPSDLWLGLTQFAWSNRLRVDCKVSQFLLPPRIVEQDSILPLWELLEGRAADAAIAGENHPIAAEFRCVVHVSRQ